MLVLSRKRGQTVMIDGGVEITVLKTKGHSVQLGIQAPETVRILRGELNHWREPSCTEDGGGARFPHAEDPFAMVGMGI